MTKLEMCYVMCIDTFGVVAAWTRGQNDSITRFGMR